MVWIGIILGICISACILISFAGWNIESDDKAASTYWLTLNLWVMYILSVIIWG